MFWFRIFPKPPEPPPRALPPFVFRDVAPGPFADGALAFEKLLTVQLWFRVLRAWQGVVEEHYHVTVWPVALVAVQQARQRRFPSIEQAHARAARLFRSRIVQREQFIALVEHAGFDRRFRAIAEVWERFLRRMGQRADLLGVAFCCHAANAVFWEAVESLRAVEADLISLSFRLIVRAVGLLSALASERMPRTQLIRAAIVLAQCHKLMRLYLVVSETCIRRKVFRELCTDGELFAWCGLESVLLSMIVEDKVLSQRFFEIQQEREVVELSVG